MPENGILTPELENAIKGFEDALQRLRTAARNGLPKPESGPIFEALRQWRADQARAKKVPPYIIASDAALRAIEAARPRDLVQLAAVRGLGQSRTDQYGAEILQVVSRMA